MIRDNGRDVGHNVSALVIQGKNRELLRIPPESSPRALRNTLIFLLFLVEFPARRNREKFWAEQGILSLEQGTSSRIRERLHAAATGSGYEPDVQRSLTLAGIRCRRFPGKQCEPPHETRFVRHPAQPTRVKPEDESVGLPHLIRFRAFRLPASRCLARCS